MILALDGEGGAEAYADYAQWEASRATRATSPRSAADSPSARGRPRAKRLGYREQREWDGMERAILDAETAAEACRQDAEDPGIAADPAALQARYAALEAARAEVARLYARWAELEAKRA
jgi:ATP-binding cassette subfamily F protein uup